MHDRQPPRRRLILLAASILMVSGCEIDISQPATPTPAASPVTLAPLVSPTILASAEPPQENSSSTPYSPVSVPTAEIPVSWGNLELTGRLVYTAADVQQQSNPSLSIQILDLRSGLITPILRTAGVSWIYYMSVSPMRGQIAMSYSPPPGTLLADQQALYTLPLDGSKLPQLLIDPPTQDDLYLQAEWSPDGKYLYYVHSSARPQTPDQLYPIYEIYRMAYPDGPPEKIAENAFWPRLSPDAARLVYVSSSVMTGKNALFIANADGSDARQVTLTGAVVPDIIDAPIFSPDGKSVLFSAPPPPQAHEPDWLEKLLGIQIAEAHTIPSDWWSVPMSGGVPTQLTHIQSPILFASVSPDGKWIASYSGNGLFVMKADGTQLTTLIPDLGGIAGMVSWIP